MKSSLLIMIKLVVVCQSFSMRGVSNFSRRRHTTPTNHLFRSTYRFMSGSDGSDGSSSSSQGDIEKNGQRISKEQRLIPTFDDYKNHGNKRDQVFSAMSKDGSVKVTACTVRNLVNDMMMAHQLSPTSAEVLSRTVVCALLMSNGMQDEQMVQISFQVDGPVGGIIAISNGLGEVRGYVGNPKLGEIELSEAVGLGTVQVVKNHPDWPRPYNGITAVRYGDIDRDVGAYLAESEQRSCALAAAASINGILCTAAGGYLIEQLPGANMETIAKVEKNLGSLVERDGSHKVPTNLLRKGMTPPEMADLILQGLDLKPLQQIEPRFFCPCTSDRLVRALRLLSPAEITDILENQENVEAKCEFCGTIYRMTRDEVRDAVANKDKEGSSLESDSKPNNKK